MDRQRAQEVLGGVEERRGVVVASHEDRVAAGGVSHPRKKAVVELLGPVAGNTGVEEVPRHQEHVDFLPGDGVSEPVQKGREFVVPFSAVQRAAEVWSRRRSLGELFKVFLPLWCVGCLWYLTCKTGKRHRAEEEALPTFAWAYTLRVKVGC